MAFTETPSCTPTIPTRWVMHRYGMQRVSSKPEILGKKFKLRIQNRRHIVTIYYSADGGKIWHKFPTQMEVSGYHHNVAYYFMSLRPAIYVAGKGKARFDNVVYRALD